MLLKVVGEDCEEAPTRSAQRPPLGMVTHRRLRRSHQRRVRPGPWQAMLREHVAAGRSSRVCTSSRSRSATTSATSCRVRAERRRRRGRPRDPRPPRRMARRGAATRLLALRRRAPVGHGLRPAGAFQAARLVDDRASGQAAPPVARHRARTFDSPHRLHRRPRAGLTTTLGYSNPPGPPGAHRAAPPATPRKRRHRRAVRRAPRQGWGQPKVSKIETGKQLPSTTDIEAWAAARSADASRTARTARPRPHRVRSFRDRFVELAGADSSRTPSAPPNSPPRASPLRTLLVPGILQTADYARELSTFPAAPASGRQRGGDQPHDRRAPPPPGDPLRARPRHHPAPRRGRPPHPRRLARRPCGDSSSTSPGSPKPSLPPRSRSSLRGPSPNRHAQRLATHRRPRHDRDRRRQPRDRRPPTRRPYWHHTQLLLNTAASGPDDANLPRLDSGLQPLSASDPLANRGARPSQSSAVDHCHKRGVRGVAPLLLPERKRSTAIRIEFRAAASRERSRRGAISVASASGVGCFRAS